MIRFYLLYIVKHEGYEPCRATRGGTRANELETCWVAVRRGKIQVGRRALHKHAIVGQHNDNRIEHFLSSGGASIRSSIVLFLDSAEGPSGPSMNIATS